MEKDGLHETVENVFLVLEMKCNLLSLGQIVEKGFTVIMGNNGQAKVFGRSKKLILRSKIS